MGNLTHAAGRLAVSKVSDVVLKNLDKDREKEIVKLVDFMKKYMDGEKLDINYEKARTMITDKNGALNHYINRLLDEVDPHVLKTMVLNLSFTLIRKYSQQLIINADRQGANRNRELITFNSGRLSGFLSSLCYAIERHF